MGGATSSEARSEQSIESVVDTNIKSGCNYVCNNNMRKVRISAENSIGADIQLEQKCVANANCQINTTADVITDIMMKTKNTADAEEKQALSLLNLSKSKVDSVQNTKQATLTEITNNCDVSAINNMEDIVINIAGSIGDRVKIEQSALATGNCGMKTASKVVSNLTEDSNNKSVAGGKSGKMDMIMWIVIAIVVLSFAGIFAKLLGNKGGGDSGMKTLITALVAGRTGKGIV